MIHNTERFCTANDLPNYEPAFSVGSIRHILHHKRRELEKRGVICQFGRKVLIDISAFRKWIAEGGAKTISKREVD